MMAKRLIIVKPTTTLISAAKLMSKKKVGALAVVKLGKLVGIVTDGDIIRKVVALGRNLKSVKVGSIMTENPATVTPDDDLYKVSKLMNQKDIKRVLVIDNKKLVGYLSERDLLKIQPGLLDVLTEKLRILQPSFKLRYWRK